MSSCSKLCCLRPPPTGGGTRRTVYLVFFFFLTPVVCSIKHTHAPCNTAFSAAGCALWPLFFKTSAVLLPRKPRFLFFLCFYGERVSDRERQMLFLFIVCVFLLWLFLTSFLFCRLFVKLLHPFVLHNASGRVVCDGEQKSRNATSCVVHKRRLQTSALAEQLICRRTKQNQIHPLS